MLNRREAGMIVNQVLTFVSRWYCVTAGVLFLIVGLWIAVEDDLLLGAVGVLFGLAHRVVYLGYTRRTISGALRLR